MPDFTLVRRHVDQEVDRTASRCSQPRAWLRMIAWLVGAGVHPKLNGTTQDVAEDLADRMDYGVGTVLYDLDGTARRLKTHRSTVKRHVKYLREAGALAWVRHGSKKNLCLGETYTATATIYAAVIPPVYDAAMGHRLSGTGYTARMIGVTDAGQERAIAEVRRRAAQRRKQRRQKRRGRRQEQGRAVDNSAAVRSGSEARAPHSPGRYPMSEKAEVSGGLKDTSRQGASRRTASPSSSMSASGGQQRQRRSPFQVARDCRIAQMVRPLVSWTQRERLRRLAYALRPLIDQGKDVHDIAAHLHAWHLDWRPSQPASYIVAQLHREAEVPEVPLLPLTADAGPSGGRAQDHPEWCAAAARLAQQVDGRRLVERTDADRARARAYADWDPRRVIEHIEDHGEDDALDLYGWRRVAQATRLTSTSTMVTTTAW